MTNLSSDLAAIGEVRQARQLGEKSVELHRQVRGEDHPCTMAAAANLSLDRRADGDDAGARTLHAEAMQRFEATLSPEHPWARLAADFGRQTLDIEPMMD